MVLAVHLRDTTMLKLHLTDHPIPEYSGKIEDILKKTKFYNHLRLFKKSIFRLPNSLKGRILINFKEGQVKDHWESAELSVHRYYVEKFMEEFSGYVRGHCLEFQEDSYSTRFGKENLTQIDIIHKEVGNPNATIIADLCNENEIPSDLFDCIICTYTLQLVYKFEAFVSELHRILKPEGNLLIAVPQIIACYPKYNEYWRFTANGLYSLLSDYFGDDNVFIRSYGNSLVAAGELRGLTSIDFLKSELDKHDQSYALVICARAMKS